MQEIRLAAVDEAVLAALVQAATSDAAADEVTPRLSGDPGWTPERVAWLLAFHRDRRAGLDGARGEATWAVVADGRVVGSVRLARTGPPATLETGIWLTRAARGRGVGTAALAALVAEAAAWGAAAVRADTAATNAGALAALRRLGFALTAAEDGRGVRATLRLPGSSGDGSATA